MSLVGNCNFNGPPESVAGQIFEGKTKNHKIDDSQVAQSV